MVKKPEKIAKNVYVKYDEHGDIENLRYIPKKRTVDDVKELAENQLWKEINKSSHELLDTGRMPYTRKAWKELWRRACKSGKL